MYAPQSKKMIIMNILDILNKYSDVNHKLTQAEIQRKLETEYDMKVDRKAVRRNLLNLILDGGYNISYTETPRMKYDAKTGRSDDNSLLTDFYIERDFDDSEIRLLLDSVIFSPHLPQSTRNDLIVKIEKLSNAYFKSSTRSIPSHDPDKWERFKAYNARDVEAEMGIQRKLNGFPVSDAIWEEYHIDQEINDWGVGVMELVAQAIRMDELSREKLTAEMKRLTELDNPNSVVQMKQWLMENGMEVDSLGKKEVAAMMRDCPDELRPALELRQQLARSSVKKYSAMKNAVCADGRARGMFQFYGANRTGRFAGRIIQLQNLPQNHLPDLAEARVLVRSGDFSSVEMIYGDVPDTLSQLIRTAFVPRKGRIFLVSDFSAIEARVIAWLAGERWRMDVFAGGGDIYCASASQMFKVPVEKNGVNGHLRQKGKIAELALGYGGSVGALKAMGAIEMGLSEEELQPLVTAWRESNPNIVKLWWDVDRCVKEVVKRRSDAELHGLYFECRSGMLFITLPSGRRLAYVKPRIGENRFGGESVTYEGVGATKKLERLESYGPKFVENIIQGMARDILCYAMCYAAPA